MGKPKNKKKEQDDISDDEVDSKAISMETEEDNARGPAPAKGKKKDKKKKKKDDDWEDDVAKELEEMSLEANKGLKQEEEVEDIPQPSKKSKKKKKKDVEEEEEEEEDDMPRTSKAAFQMLMMDDDEGDNANDNDDNDEEESKQSEIVLENVKEAGAGGKKKDKKAKKKDKAKTKEEEDIDAILASLDAPTEKKKGKKKQAEDSKEATPDLEGTDQAAATAGPEGSEVKENGSEPGLAKEAKEGEVEEEGEEEGGSTIKTAAQKRKEKKEREKQKKLKEKQKSKKQAEKAVAAEGEGEAGQASVAEAASEAAAEDAAAKPQDEEGEEEEGTSKKKKKKKGEKEEKKEKKPKKQVAAILELQRKLKEEQERLEREERERIAREEEEQRIAEEKKRVEEEKKQKKKEKEKARKERLKSEGKLLTEKQKQDRRRLNQMLESMKEQGLELPHKDDAPKKKPMYIDKRKKKQQQNTEEKTPSPTEEKAEEVPEEMEKEEEKGAVEASTEEPKEEEVKEEEEEETDEVKDAWDVSDSEGEDEEEGEEEEKPQAPKKDVRPAAAAKKPAETKEDEESEEEEEDEESDDDDEDEDDSEEESEEESDEDDGRTLMDRVREKLQKYHEEAEKKRTTDVLRAPVVCVLGHVDTGKTKILDKLRQTNVQNSEAGGITQQIGATNVPKDEIQKKTFMCKEFQKAELKLPGLLIIDTPGHESFSNMRSRGSSLCDIAILVIDIMHSIEPQTRESIGLLKQRKTPFVVALNKIDRLYNWQSNPKLDVASVIKKQGLNTKAEFDERAQKVMLELAEMGLNAALYYENKNPKEYISLVPTSAHTGDGMGNLVALICELTQTMMAKRISYSEELQASVMEVKNLQGLGTTIDVILVNGKLKLGDQIVVAGTEGPITTTIKGLLQPQPMRELRVKSQYVRQTEVMAAQGVKIVAKDLEKSLAGLPLYVPRNADEAEFYRMELENSLAQVLKSFESKDKGVYVQASTLGSLEALLEFLRTSKIPYSGINLGDVHKKDVIRACAMLEHDKMYAVILAFDVKVEREAQELAEKEGVTIFTADIIYTLFDRFMEHVDKLKKERQAEFKHLAVFPCKLKILPQHIFKTRDPIVCGVQVEAGSVVEGTPVCVPSKEFLDLGRVVSIESNNKPVERAQAGMEVCIKIEAVPGETPKMIGRHFEATDTIVSKISRQSIDTMKTYFRDEMSKTDWLLIMELKKQFEII